MPAFVVCVEQIMFCIKQSELCAQACCANLFGVRKLNLSSFCVMAFAVAIASSSSLCAADETIATHALVTVTDADLRADMAGRPPELLRRMREPDSPSGERMAADILLRRLVAKRALEDGMATRPDIRDRLKIAEERALYEIYMEKAEVSGLSESRIEAVAREDYKAFPERFTKPEEVRVRHILIRPCGGGDSQGARARAELVLDKLRSGEPFDLLAQTYSDDLVSAKRGGDLGLKQKGAMVPEVEAAAFSLKRSGDISEIIESQFGLHILRLEERREAVLRSFDEVKDSLLDNVRSRMRADLRKKIIDTLRDSAQFKVDAEAVRRAVVADQ